ncbi:MAG: helix-turn-helix domain-containing protein, partial [Bacteroidota bacterium]|nr:helix-turn-helix domain-containing protein [Bacteroidota bacterium]
FLLPVKSYCVKNGLASRIGQKTRKRERQVKAKTAPVRQRVSDTRSESLRLYKSGKNINDIAIARSLSPTTVESHLAYFIQTGEMEVGEMVSESKIPAIKDAVESYGADRLSPLKEILGEDYSYSEIKAVVSWMQREGTLT